MVCVTVNYRLGADGFLFLGDGISNLGILDQIAALEWVRDNIAVFGGDLHNVTIAGESAGAMSVTTLLSMAQTQGLFRRVIAQSGAGHHVLSAAIAQKVGQYLAEKLEVSATREAIGSVPLERLLQAQVELSQEVIANPDPAKWGEALMLFEPVVDGVTILARPIDSIAAGAGAGVDVLIGTNADEQRLFMVPNGIINYINEDILKGTIAAYGLPVEETLTIYCQNRPDATPGDLLEAIVTDWFFRIPAIRVAEARVRETKSNTFMYEFAWRSPQFEGKLGACHSLEIPFAFNNLDKEGNEALEGSHPPQELADSMHAGWVAFITNGNPGWSQYNLEQRATMRFDQNSEIVNDPRAAERELWEGHR